MIRQDYKSAWNESSAKCICSTPELIEAFKGRLPSNKGKTGKHWHLENGVRIWTGEWK